MGASGFQGGGGRALSGVPSRRPGASRDAGSWEVTRSGTEASFLFLVQRSRGHGIPTASRAPCWGEAPKSGRASCTPSSPLLLPPPCRCRARQKREMTPCRYYGHGCDPRRLPRECGPRSGPQVVQGEGPGEGERCPPRGGAGAGTPLLWAPEPDRSTPVACGVSGSPSSVVTGPSSGQWIWLSLGSGRPLRLFLQRTWAHTPDTCREAATPSRVCSYLAPHDLPYMMHLSCIFHGSLAHPNGT